MPDITVGTRVIHRRYSQLVGKVVDGPLDGHLYPTYLVQWDNTTQWFGDVTHQELLSDLRATPVQP